MQFGVARAPLRRCHLLIAALRDHHDALSPKSAPSRIKRAKGLGPGVLEVIADHRGDTYRAVYTVRFAERVYVLHVFQKKSTKGIATPHSVIELVRQRLKRAAELDQKREH